MKFKKEFALMESTLKKFRVPVKIYKESEIADIIKCKQNADSLEYLALCDLFKQIEGINEREIVRVTNTFSISYVAFLNAGSSGKKDLTVIGPMIYERFTPERMLEIGEINKVPPSRQKSLEQYFSLLPILNKESHLFYLIESYCESIWGTADYAVSEIIDASPYYTNSIENVFGIVSNTVEMASVELMEERYSYENGLIEAVSTGNLGKVGHIISSFNEISFNLRQADVLREMKNYCIISNTLLRKAAENGGVHPYYLDATSSSFARRIEGLSSERKCIEMIKEIFYTYCRLVNQANTKNYSPIVEKGAIYIWNNLQEQLSLSIIAKQLNVSKGYLSAIFKKETGKTITRFILTERINKAVHLLKTTKLQVQTISQYCGILDLQYFSEQFKKITGKTPKEFR